MKKTLIRTEVTYTLAHGGKFYIIEHVPTRVCRETGEQNFSPETVERIQALALQKDSSCQNVSRQITIPDGVYPRHLCNKSGLIILASNDWPTSAKLDLANAGNAKRFVLNLHKSPG